MDDYTSCETNLKIPISSWGRTSLALKRSQIEIDRGRLSSEGGWVLYLRDFLVAGDKKRNAQKSHSVFCAQEQSRTATPFLALPPESSASTNFATCAQKWDKDKEYFFDFRNFS